MSCIQGKVSVTSRVSRAAANPILDVLFAPALGPDGESWVFLIKRVSVLLLSSISKYPRCVDKVQPMRSEATQYAY
jgi:hypothetical protein